MPEPTLSLSDPFTRGLACAALQPGLRSILVFDAKPPTLQAAAQTWSEMLTAVTDKCVEIVTLASTVTDDDLWGSLTLYGEDLSQTENHDLTITWQSGLLGKSQDSETLRMVVIPDLTCLSLAAARACVVLMGSSIAHLERHGQQMRWSPNICWLAGCARDEIGQVSPHLLDRFALRLHAAKMPQPDRMEALINWLEVKSSLNVVQAHPPQLPNSFREKLQKKREIPIIITEAIQRVLDYVSSDQQISLRREIALARLAQANAQLEGTIKVEIQQIDAAAQMIGLGPILPKVSRPIEDEPEIPQSELEQPKTDPISEPSYPSSTTQSAETITSAEEEVFEPDKSEVLETAELYLDTTYPWPEDKAPVEREIASLRLPWQRQPSVMAGRGAVIGVQRADMLHDLAIASTIFEAAKFQTIRRKYNPGEHRFFLLWPTDLRKYRRNPVPEQMLVLVLDYTCLRDVDWQEALLPYLRWAYVERASICLIQVGAATARNELRAERVIVHSILSPQIGRAFESQPGRATPLAHGLDLARQTLQNVLQQGLHPVRHAHLVVLTDGRGNVTLEASRMGQLKCSLNREGIEEAFTIAQSISGLKHLKKTILDPQPQQHTELPIMLGEALGANSVSVSRLEEVPS